MGDRRQGTGDKKDEIAIKVDNVSKSFKLPHEKHGSVKNAFVNILRPRRTYEKQEVLKNISFDIKKGEFFGIVGRNGSGKSTLLKLLAGIYSPDKGAIHVNGKLTPFIELGVGFNPELTGRENVFLNGSLLGFSREEMNDMYDDIVEFAELEKFMDQKLKNYSSGMQVRLAFSIAIKVNTDIILLDEVLAVGDAIFQKKCYEYFKKLKRNKKTVIFVSHDTDALLEYCDRGVLIESGDIVSLGNIDKIIDKYHKILLSTQTTEDKPSNHKVDSINLAIYVDSVKTFLHGEKTKKFSDNENIQVEVIYKSNENISSPVYGITIFDESGERVFTSNTLWSKVSTDNLKSNEKVKVAWKLPNVFNNGNYRIVPAVADQSGSVILNQMNEGHTFQVDKRLKSNSYINVDHDIVVSKTYKRKV